MGNMRTRLDNDCLKAVQEYGITVDKEELIKALQYDRGQYEKGYADGKRDAVEHSRWKHVKGGSCTGGGNPLWGCSKCNYIAFASMLPPKYNYCPNCGAKMDKGE